jgi:hypothetical protein
MSALKEWVDENRVRHSETPDGRVFIVVDDLIRHFEQLDPRRVADDAIRERLNDFQRRSPILTRAQRKGAALAILALLGGLKAPPQKQVLQ